MWSRGVRGAGGGWWILLLSCLLALCSEAAVRRKHETAYIVDPVGNPLSKPVQVPPKVGSPGSLVQPDRYEFYTFDESGELIKRLMTLREIQEIIATGDGEDGHVLTVAQTDLSKPAVTFNLQPPSHTKVHSIVSNVKNVLKAEMEAQKIKPPKENMFDTPDVSSSWSMILPAIFGNTGGSIAPDSLISMHSAPETDVITVIKDVPKPETQTEQTADDSESQRPKPESITQSLLEQISDDTDDIENDDNTYFEVEDLIEEELSKFASKATDSVLLDDVSTSRPVTESGIKLEKITTASQPTTERIVYSTEPIVVSTTRAPITNSQTPVVTNVESTVSESTTNRLTTQTEKETEGPVSSTTTKKDIDQTTVKTVFTKIPLIQKVNNTDNFIKLENGEKATIIPTSLTTLTTTDNINKITSIEPTTEKQMDISTTSTQKPNILNKDSTTERTTTEIAYEELFVSKEPIKQQEIISEGQTISTQTPSPQFSTRVTQTEPTRETITQSTTIQTKPTDKVTSITKTTLSQEITDSTTFKTTTKTNFADSEIEGTTEKENEEQNKPIFTKLTEIKSKPIQNNLNNNVLEVVENEDGTVEDLAVTTYKPNVRPLITNTAQPNDKITPVPLIEKPVNKTTQNIKKPIITSSEDESLKEIQVPQTNQQHENQKDVIKIQDTTKNIVSTTPKNTISDIKVQIISSGVIKPISELHNKNKTSTINNKRPITTHDAFTQQSANKDKNDVIKIEDNKEIITSTTPKNTFVKISSSNTQEIQDSTTSEIPIDQKYSSTTESSSTPSSILTTTVKKPTTFSEITTKETTEENLQLDVYQLINKISNDLVNEKNSSDEITTILNKLLTTTTTRPNTVSTIQETSYNTKTTSIVNTQPSLTTPTTIGDISNQEDNLPSSTPTTNENKILEEKTTSITQNPTTERVSLPDQQFSYNLSESISDVLSQFNVGFKTTIVPTTYTSSTNQNSDSEEGNYSSEKVTDFVKTTITTLSDNISTKPTTTEKTKVEELTTKEYIQTTTSTQSSEPKTSQRPQTTPHTTVLTTNKPKTDAPTTNKIITDKPTTNNPTIRISITPSYNEKNNNTNNIIHVNIKNKEDNLTSDFITPIYKRTESTTKHNTPITASTTVKPPTEKPPTEKPSTTKTTTIRTKTSTAENSEKPADDDELMEMLNKYTEMLKISENTFMKTPTKSESLPKPWKLINNNTKDSSNLNNEPNIDKLDINIDGLIENLKLNTTQSIEISTENVKNPNNQNEKITYTHAELPVEKLQNFTINKLIPRKEISTNNIPIKNFGHLTTNKPVQKIPVVNSRISLDEMENLKEKFVNSTSKHETSSHKNKISTSSSTPIVKIEESTTKSQSLLNKIEKQKEKITQDLINISLIKDTKNSSNSENEWKLVPIVHSKTETSNESNFKPGAEQSSIKPQVFQRPPQTHHSNQAIKNYQSQKIGQIHLPGINGGEGLQRTTAGLGEDVFQFSKFCNELAFRYWDAVSSNGLDPKRSLIVSPFAVTSLLAMVFLGARGATSGEMNDILKLDDMVTFNPHIVFKNVTESIEVSKKSGVATSAFIRELYSDRAKGRLLSFYKDRVQQFYSGHVEEANFKIIGDIIRRRTNLLVKRYTWSKIPEYIKANNMILRPPLSIFSANVFQTDCSIASTEGRDGEMYFVVSPTIRQRRLIPVPAVVYKSGFLAGYVPELDATVVAIDKGDQIVSTIFVMPGQQGSTAQGDDIQDLQKRLVNSAVKDDTWTKLLKSLTPRQGLELQIPRLSHRSIINGTAALQKMGLKELFDSEKADLRGLNGQANDLYLTDLMLVNTFSTCGEGYIGEQHHVEVYPGEPNKVQRRLWRIPHRPIIQEADGTHTAGEFWDEPRDYQRAFHDPLHDTSYLLMPLHLRPRQARLPDLTPEPPRLKFDRPFMFFVRHNPTGLILHMGRYNPRLLP